MADTPTNAKLRKLAQDLINGRADRGEWAMCFAVALHPDDEPRGRKALAVISGLNESAIAAVLKQTEAHGLLELEDVGGEAAALKGVPRYAVRLAEKYLPKRPADPCIAAIQGVTSTYTPPPVEQLDRGCIAASQGGVEQLYRVSAENAHGTADATRAGDQSLSLKNSSPKDSPKDLSNTLTYDADSDESAALAADKISAPTPKRKRATKGKRGITDPRVAEAFERWWTAYGLKVNPAKCAELFAAVPEAAWPELARATRNYVAATDPVGGEGAKRQRRDPERFLKADWWRAWINADPRSNGNGGNGGPKLKTVAEIRAEHERQMGVTR